KSSLNIDEVVNQMVQTLRFGEQDQTPPSDVPNSEDVINSTPITLQGTFVCLPHHDSIDGPVTLECALGLQDDEGNYYSIRDSDPNFENVGSIPTGVRVEVVGAFEPGVHYRYQGIGTIEVEDIDILN